MNRWHAFTAALAVAASLAALFALGVASLDNRQDKRFIAQWPEPDIPDYPSRKPMIEAGAVSNYTDDFNRADEDLEDSPNWEQRAGSAAIVNNECVIEPWSLYAWTQEVAGDHSVIIPGSSQGGAAVRIPDSGWGGYVGITEFNFSIFMFSFRLYRMETDGSFTQLASVGAPGSSSPDVRTEAEGSTIRMVIGTDTVVLSVSDSVWDDTNTNVGIATRNLGLTIPSWSGGPPADVDVPPSEVTGTAIAITGGQAVVGRDSAITGTGSVVVGGQAVIARESAVTGTGAVIAAGQAVVQTESGVVGTGAVVVGGQAVIARESAVTGTGAVIAAGQAVVQTESGVVGTGAVVATGQAVIARDSLVTGTASVIADAQQGQHSELMASVGETKAVSSAAQVQAVELDDSLAQVWLDDSSLQQMGADLDPVMAEASTLQVLQQDMASELSPSIINAWVVGALVEGTPVDFICRHQRTGRLLESHTRQGAIVDRHIRKGKLCK